MRPDHSQRRSGAQFELVEVPSTADTKESILARLTLAAESRSFEPNLPEAVGRAAASSVMDLSSFVLGQPAGVRAEIMWAIVTELQRSPAFLHAPPALALDVLGAVPDQEAEAVETVGADLLRDVLWAHCVLGGVAANLPSTWRKVSERLTMNLRRVSVSRTTHAALQRLSTGLFVRAVSARDVTFAWRRNDYHFDGLPTRLEETRKEGLLLFEAAHSLIAL